MIFRKDESLIRAGRVSFPILFWRFVRHDGRLTPEEARFHIVPANKTSEFVARVRNARGASDANIDRGSNHHRPPFLCPRLPLVLHYIRGIITLRVHLCTDACSASLCSWRLRVLQRHALSSKRYRQTIGNIGNITPYLRPCYTHPRRLF